MEKVAETRWMPEARNRSLWQLWETYVQQWTSSNQCYDDDNIDCVLHEIISTSRSGSRSLDGRPGTAIGGGDAGADLPPRVRRQRHAARAGAARTRGAERW